MPRLRRFLAHHNLFHHYLHHIHHHHFSHFPSQEKLLLVIEREKKVTPSKLLQELDIKPSSLSELLGKLEKRRLIVRAKNTDDKREVIVSLTSKGEALAAKMKKWQNGFTEKFLGVLSEKEQEQLGDILEKLHSHHGRGEQLHFSMRGRYYRGERKEHE